MDVSGRAAKFWDRCKLLKTIWRPVRESNPCRRREREATYCNSMGLSGMDSTLPHFKDSQVLLLDSYWTRVGIAISNLTIQSASSTRCSVSGSHANQQFCANLTN